MAKDIVGFMVIAVLLRLVAFQEMFLILQYGVPKNGNALGFRVYG